MQRRHAVDGMRFAADGEAIDAELELGADLFQRRVGSFAAGEAIRENSD